MKTKRPQLMKNIFLTALLLFFFFFEINNTQAQPCDTATEVTVEVTILTDPYPYETSWDIVGVDGTVYAAVDLDATYAANTEYKWEACLPQGTCAVFNIYDSFGDGLEFPSFYAIAIDGVEVENNTLQGQIASYYLNCPPGFACTSPLVIDEGTYTTPFDNAWYLFTPPATGQYKVTTCNLATCDTKIWMFESCNTAHNGEDNEGTIAYDDNFGNCGEQANISISLQEGVPVYIRIGDDNDACNGEAIVWQIEYVGAASGCTDPASCNYNPLATIDDGSCLPYGHPDCPDAPDLTVRQDILTSSAYLSQIEATDPCLVEEGCLNGYGLRDIIRFTTFIENNGDADYYIGTPGVDDSQFTYDNCHNHWHYDGYAEYVLYDENGVELPVGFKNGFCVIDLGCTSGAPQYTCTNMGISVGCYDEYWAELECQWIDITDVPDGRYTFVTRVNWDNAPDALGRKEKDTLNNWAQMCIILDRSSGSLQFSQDDNCQEFVDCKGVVFGDAEYDCEGVCDGTALYGDLNTDLSQTELDAQGYIDGILNQNLSATSCNDLSGDGRISVYDAALMVDCAIYGSAYQSPTGGVEDHCRFPSSLFNINQTVGLTILGQDDNQNYIDVGIKSTAANLVAYQFYTSGMNITSVESLVDPQSFPLTPSFGQQGVVLGVSMVDSVIFRGNDWQPLVRIYHDGAVTEEICLADNPEFINENYELTNHYLEDNCVTISSLAWMNDELAVRVFPNPFTEKTILTFDNTAGNSYQLTISDVGGKVVQHIRGISGNQVAINGHDLAKGVYLYQLVGKAGIATGKLIVE